MNPEEALCKANAGDVEAILELTAYYSGQRQVN